MIKDTATRTIFIVVLILVMGLMVTIGRNQGYLQAQVDIWELEYYLEACFEREDIWLEMLSS